MSTDPVDTGPVGTGAVNTRAALSGAAATLLSAASLSTLVQGVAWFTETLLVVLAVVATGAALRRWPGSRPLAVAGQAAAGLAVLTWLFAAPSAVAGLLPGPAALTQLVSLGELGVDLSRQVAAPAPAVPGVRLLVVAGIGAVALLVDALAATLRQPAVAGLPLLAVYTVPVALLPNGLPWYWFALAAVGFLLLVASDSGERVSRWGRVLAGEGGTQAPMAAAGRRVGALALGAALLVPVLVPGLSQGLRLDRGGSGDGPGEGTITVGNPIIDLRDDLLADADVPVIRYQTEVARPDPLRIVTVDTFDGDRWRPTTGDLPRSQRASGDLPTPPGLAAGTPAELRRTRIDVVGNLRETYLPVPYPPVRVDLLGPWLYEAETLNIVGDGVTTRQGMGYSVQYLDVVPEPEALLDAGPAAADVTTRWTQLPDEVPPVVAQTAQEVAGDRPAYAQATALQQWFRSGGGFEYSIRAPEPDGPSAIADFLSRRSGYCVHFASSMAVMARSLGIPARVAVGYLPGEQQPDGSWEITVRDAHAWPELYFAGAGWVRFEPTPATRTGTLPSWAAPPPELAQPEPTTAPTAAPAEPEPRSPNAVEGADAQTGGLDLAAVLAAVPWRAVAALAVVLAIVLAPAATATVVRRRRWARATSAAQQAEAAWTTLAERAADLDLAWPASATPRQVEARLAAELDRGGVSRSRVAGSGGRSSGRSAAGGSQRAALHRVTRALERARYAPSPEPGDGLRHDVRTIVRALREVVPAQARARARWLPASGAEHLRSAMVDGGLALDRAERRTAGRIVTPLRRLLGRRPA